MSDKIINASEIGICPLCKKMSIPDCYCSFQDLCSYYADKNKELEKQLKFSQWELIDIDAALGNQIRLLDDAGSIDSSIRMNNIRKKVNHQMKINAWEAQERLNNG